MMYNSGITTVEFLESIISEVDISYPIGKTSWVTWLNAVEQLLYSEIIHDRRSINIYEYRNDTDYDLDDIAHNEKEASVEERDLVHVYIVKEHNGKYVIDEAQGSSYIGYNNIAYDSISGMKQWCVYNHKLYIYSEPDSTYYVWLVYNARPVLKRADNDAFGDEEIYLPPEFLPMLAAKLRGEAYKLANEDGLAAKWLADYNAQLEDFKAWHASHAPSFGE